jgi:MFS family permease
MLAPKILIAVAILALSYVFVSAIAGVWRDYRGRRRVALKDPFEAIPREAYQAYGLALAAVAFATAGSFLVAFAPTLARAASNTAALAAAAPEMRLSTIVVIAGFVGALFGVALWYFRQTLEDIARTDANGAAASPASVIGSILFHDDGRGELTAYLGVDLSGPDRLGEGQQLIRIDDHLLKDDSRRRAARDYLVHLGFPLVEGGDHFIVANLSDALEILSREPRHAYSSNLPNHKP